MQFNILAEHKNASGVYIIRNNLNDKVYIGSSVMLKRRFKTHRSKLLLGYHDNKYLQSFVSKYGCERLSFELIELARPGDLSHLAELEQHYISLYDSANRKRGFNLVPVVFPRVQFSEETKKRQSIKARARGVSRAAIQGLKAYIAANGAHNKGVSNKVPATCPKCNKEFLSSPSRSQKFCSRACWRTSPVSAETRERISLLSRGKPKSPEAIAKQVASRKLNNPRPIISCETCRAQFPPNNSRQRFCSRECFNRRIVSQETRAKHAACVGRNILTSEAKAKAYNTRKNGKGWVHGPEQVAKRLATIAAKASPQQLSIF